MIARLGRLLPRRRASGSIYDAEHFFDGYRDDPGYALECLRRRGRGRRRERHPLRHQRLQPAGAGRRGDRARWSTTLGERAEIGIHTHNDCELRGRQLAGRGRARARAWSRARSTASASAAATPT